MGARADIKAGLKTLVANILGLAAIPHAVVWDGEEDEAFHRAPPRVTLHWTGETTNGVDERRNTYNNTGVPPADRLEVRQQGMRTWTLSITVETDSQCGESDAETLCEKVRLRLRRESNLITLRGLGLAVIRFLPTVKLDREEDLRYLSVANLDIQFHRAEIDDYDNGTGATDYFNQVEPVTCEEP